MGLIKMLQNERSGEDERVRARDCGSLVERLEDLDPVVRRWAARDLTDCQGASAALLSRLAREHDATVREVILTALAHLSDDTAIAGLAACLRTEDVELRNQSSEVLKQLPGQVAPLIENLLADHDTDVRIFTVHIIGALRHPNVESWLVEVIENDPNVNVCAAAVDLLVEVGSQVSKKPLEALKLRFTQEPYIQFAVDLALKRISED